MYSTLPAGGAANAQQMHVLTGTASAADSLTAKLLWLAAACIAVFGRRVLPSGAHHVALELSTTRLYFAASMLRGGKLSCCPNFNQPPIYRHRGTRMQCLCE